MTNINLYIIGNGFDIHHGIESRYSDFKKYLETNDIESFDCITEYMSTIEENWSNFEEALAEVDFDLIQDSCASFLVSYGAEDWSDSNHHDYEHELDTIVTNLRDSFKDWVQNLNVTICPELYLNLDVNSHYLNFNYTPTLTKLYNISPTNILHIHGTKDSPVYGHGTEPKESYLAARGEIKSKDDLCLREDDENDDPRVLGGSGIIKDYFSKTYKPCKEIISSHISFFEKLKYISRICVLGHSLSEIDKPYFEEVVKWIKPSVTKWEISCYTKSNEEFKEEQERIFNFISNLGIDRGRIEVKKLEQF